MTQQAVQDLLNQIQIERLDLNLFRGYSPPSIVNRIYGGLVLAQSIHAAGQTVEGGFVLHSLHSYFLRMGDPSHPVIYQVDRIRDGRTFATRRVEAIQGGKAIFHATLSYQLPEEGLEHQHPCPENVPRPEALQPDSERFRFIAPDHDWPVNFYHVNPVDPQNPQVAEPRSLVWFKTTGTVPNDDLSCHQALLAHASDNPILLTALRPHGVNHFSQSMQVATVDHALWFHRPFRVDEWLLYEIESPNASNGRGFSLGRIYDAQGRLVVSAAQEGVIRRA